MSPEGPKQQVNSEIIRNPVILVDRVRNLLSHPENERERKEFRDWLLNDWKIINNLLLQFPFQILLSSTKEPRTNLCEEKPRILSLKGVDRAIATLSYSSRSRDEDGKEKWMQVFFVADGEKRDDLIGLSIKTSATDENGIFGGIEEIFEIKVSPELKIAKLK